MKALLLDTHAAVWHLRDPARLSSEARDRIRASVVEGSPLFVSIISLIELVYLVEKGRVPGGALKELKSGMEDPLAAIQVLPIDSTLLEAVERIPRNAVPDMPDRIIAATALQRGLALVTRDRRLQESGIETVW